MEAPDLTRLIEEVHRDHEADITLIEDADLGRGISQNLLRTSSYCRPTLRRPMIDKIARMQARSVMFETGKVVLPREAEWLDIYVQELLGFRLPQHSTIG